MGLDLSSFQKLDPGGRAQRQPRVVGAGRNMHGGEGSAGLEAGVGRDVEPGATGQVQVTGPGQAVDVEQGGEHRVFEVCLQGRGEVATALVSGVKD